MRDMEKAIDLNDELAELFDFEKKDKEDNPDLLAAQLQTIV